MNRVLEGLIARAEEFSERGEFAQARAVMARVLLLAPVWSPGLVKLGVLLRSFGEPDRSLILLRRAYHCDPGEPGVVFALATGLLQARENTSATDMFRRAAMLRPDGSPPLVQLAESSRNERALKLAAQFFSRALCLSPLAQRPRMMQADCLSRLGQPREAVAAAKRALALDPRVAALYWRVGIDLSATSQRIGSLIALRRACLISPTWGEAWLSLVGIEFADRNFARAEYAARQAIGLGTALAEAHFWLARALIALDRADEARIAFDQAVELKPDLKVEATIAQLTVTSSDFIYRADNPPHR